MSFKYVKCLSINFLSILANNLNFIKKNSIITSVRKMESVKRNETTLIIKNSKFISLIDKVKSEEEVNTLLKEAKHKYPNATHYCYAYIIDTIKKESDDGEPGGTAGIPILQVLEKNELNYVLCIVIRYFGKIKLGAGGLVRAYTKSTTQCLKNHITTLEKGYQINITFPYSLLKKINHIIQNEKLIKEEYNELITFEIEIRKNKKEEIESLKNNVKINKISEIFIESTY